MVGFSNKPSKRTKGSLLSAGILLAFAICQPASAMPVSYTYDDLNRLKSVDYNNGEQVINYTYDAAGNMISKTITATGDSLPPLLAIDSPANGTALSIPSLLVSGTATDAGQGANGIASVTVNGIRADNDTASSSATANWSLDAGASLGIGLNALDVTATDGSPSANQASDSVTVVYLPMIVDGDADGMPDGWESAKGVSEPGLDDDSDGVTNIEEYKADTDPQDDTSKPEGASGVNYVFFRDHFDDEQYDYRWYITALDLESDYTLTEAGTEIQAAGQTLESGCAVQQFQSFATVDAVNTAVHARLRLDGYGQTLLGLMQGVDETNRIDVLFDNDSDPYLQIRSVDNGTAVDFPAALPGPYQGTSVDLRITKKGDQYSVYVNNVLYAAISHGGLGDVALRSYVGTEHCDTDAGYVDTKIDVIEFLLDTDADGRADTHEDANANGVVDPGESDPGIADMDTDGALDGHDNCLFLANPLQRDTDGDGYGNLCDGDLNNDGAINFADLGLLKSVFFTADPNADLNGDGAVNFADLGLLKSMFFTAPGPSGLEP